jgi:hypothetical protein
MDGNLWNAQSLSKGLVGQSSIAADKLAGSIHHQLRSVDTVQAKALGIGTLPLTVAGGRVWVLPSDMVLVVHVFTEYDHLRARYRLPIKLLQKPARWGTAGAPLRCEEFHQQRSTSIRSSVRPMQWLRSKRQNRGAYRKHAYDQNKENFHCFRCPCSW